MKWIYNLLYAKKDNEIECLKSELEILNELIKINPKEEYYNNKYPKSDLTYLRNETDGIYKIDLRNFINPYDATLPIITGNSDDAKAYNGLMWIIKNIKYISDSSLYAKAEYWAYSYQTLFHKEGDCEDGAILLYNILLKNGVPYWKLRLSAGNVLLNKNKVGHAYLTYYCEASDKWVVLDWCYWPNMLEISDRKDYKDEENYLEVWFSFNQKYCFTKGLNEGNNLL